MSLFNELTVLLQHDPRLVSDGQLLKNQITELALKLDPELLRLLLSHEGLEEHFFAAVDGLLVFDKEKFIRFVNNKAFLPDSYTSFKNKIGLATSDGRYLGEGRDVVLAWPYKDCVLEGGQTEEDLKRNEVFWNEILAPDEVDRLLAPKVLTRWRRYDADGSHAVTEFGDADNLIIKGNNLLALHSLVKRYAGQVKLIYIDPPYNTGHDSFRYNDRFSHSTWLTFMENRLTVARKLLRKDGSIWINIDDNEAHYLKVLADEVFDRVNFVRNVLWQKRTSPDTRATVGDGHDHVLVFAKDIDSFKQTANRIPKTEEQRTAYTNPDNDPRGPWVSSDFTAQGYRPNQMYTIVTPGGAEHDPPEGRCWKNIEPVYLRLVGEGRMWFGQDGQGVPRRKTYISEVADNAVWSWWANNEVGHSQEAKKESIALFGADNPFTTPKPERLLQRIIHIASNPGDLVVDFFLGSGTTTAVAHKMSRRYIGIEQMDYVERFPVARLQKVIGRRTKPEGHLLEALDYDGGGISEDTDWQGGGSFVYCELMQWNERFVRRILSAKDKATLQATWDEMREKAHLSYRLDVEQFDEQATDFADLSLKDQRRFLMELLDKNQLYVALSEMDDETYGVSDEDKRLNRLFHGI